MPEGVVTTRDESGKIVLSTQTLVYLIAGALTLAGGSGFVARGGGNSAEDHTEIAVMKNDAIYTKAALDRLEKSSNETNAKLEWIIARLPEGFLRKR